MRIADIFVVGIIVILIISFLLSHLNEVGMIPNFQLMETRQNITHADLNPAGKIVLIISQTVTAKYSMYHLKHIVSVLLFESGTIAVDYTTSAYYPVSSLTRKLCRI